MNNKRFTLIRSAQTRRPAYTLRRCSLRHHTLETPFCRSYLSGHPTPPHPNNPPGGEQKLRRVSERYPDVSAKCTMTSNSPMLMGAGASGTRL